MKYLILMLTSLILFTSCSKESQEEDIYGYEVECDHCTISYLDADERYVSIHGQQKHWRIEFRPKFVFQLQVTANAESSSSGQINVYVLLNGSRIKSASGNGSISTVHQISSAGSVKPKPDATKPSSGSTLCGAPTQKGGSCQRKVVGGGRCWQH